LLELDQEPSFGFLLSLQVQLQNLNIEIDVATFSTVVNARTKEQNLHTLPQHLMGGGFDGSYLTGA
jgi:hypothetical protein